MGRSTKLAPSARSPFFCGDIDIRIAADGTWFHEGSPIGRKELVKLFASGYSRFAGWLLAVLVIQVSLGISNVVYSLPLSVAVAYNGVAALLLLSMVALVHTLGQLKYRS